MPVMRRTYSETFLEACIIHVGGISNYAKLGYIILVANLQ